MILACHQPQYLAWPGYYRKMAFCDVFVYLDAVQYKRREYQNRNRIKTCSGAMWLTVPVRTRSRPGQAVRGVEIDGDAWAARHLRALSLCYGRAPAFKEHEGFLRAFYGRRWGRLMDVCLEWDRHMRRELGIETDVVLESAAGSEGAATERILSLCRKFGCSDYLSGAGGRKYLDEDAFRRAGIGLRYQEFGLAPYPQRFGPFIGNLSAADLLFNCGSARARRVLSRGGAPYLRANLVPS